MEKIANLFRRNVSKFRYNFESTCSAGVVVSKGHLSTMNERIEKKIKQNEMERVASKDVAGGHIVR